MASFWRASSQIGLGLHSLTSRQLRTLQSLTCDFALSLGSKIYLQVLALFLVACGSLPIAFVLFMWRHSPSWQDAIGIIPIFVFGLLYLAGAVALVMRSGAVYRFDSRTLTQLSFFGRIVWQENLDEITAAGRFSSTNATPYLYLQWHERKRILPLVAALEEALRVED
jgi:hypothetical protein